MRALPLLLALAVLPAAALGDERALAPFRAEFSGGLNCGKPEDFSAELLRRSQHIRPARSGETGFVFRIDVREGEGSLEGRLTLREPDGRVTVRVVPGATCAEIIPALAVIAAVLVEPSATAEPPEPPPVAPATRPEALGWGFGASLGAVLQGAVAPKAMGGASLEANSAFESGGILSPLFALAYNITLTGEAPTPNGIGIAKLGWWTVRTSLCPVRWPQSGKLALRPCAFFDLGRLYAEGTATERQESASMTWVAPGASARLDVTPFAGIWLTAEAGVFRPLNRDRFLFDPEQLAFQPPKLGGFGRLAVGGRFQ